MFTRGSRYRNLPESAVVDPAGEWIRGKDLRLIPPLEDLLPSRGQQVTHTVLEGDRVDLLALKYYADTTKWWQIGDVNPEYPFPTDLLGRGPLVEEVFTLEHPGFLTRYAQTLADLGALGSVRTQFAGYFRGDESPGSVVAEAAVFDPRRGDQGIEPSFVEAAVVLKHATSVAARPAVLAALAAAAFRLLRSFAWEEGTDTTEVFLIEDPAVKGDWRALIEGLEHAAGVKALRTDTTDLTVALAYNGEVLRPESLPQFMAAKGFIVKSVARASRVGGTIVIPPTEIV
jgi:hypothetical protein